MRLPVNAKYMLEGIAYSIATITVLLLIVFGLGKIKNAWNESKIVDIHAIEQCERIALGVARGLVTANEMTSVGCDEGIARFALVNRLDRLASTK